MKRILLLATGGTIASVEGMKGLFGLSAEELLNYFSKSSRNLEIDCKILMNIDSTNMQPEHWKEIANAVLIIMITMTGL